MNKENLLENGKTLQPFRIYSEARAKWLEKAVKMLYQKPSKRSPKQFDDWVAEDQQLTKKGE